MMQAYIRYSITCSLFDPIGFLIRVLTWSCSGNVIKNHLFASDPKSPCFSQGPPLALQPLRSVLSTSTQSAIIALKWRMSVAEKLMFYFRSDGE